MNYEQQTSYLIEELIENKLFETLKKIRETLYYPVTLGMPIESIREENRVMIERIDSVIIPDLNHITY